MIHRTVHTTSLDLEVLRVLQKARRLREKGDIRRMFIVLGQACALHEQDARLWSMYGGLLAAHGRTEDARIALRRALFLRRQERDVRRERSTRALLSRIEGEAA